MGNMIDLHIHSTASDGSDSIPELLENIRKAGIHTFAVTDHDTMEGALEMDALVTGEFRYIRGIEFSCISPKGKCHILGYNFDPTDTVFLDALTQGTQLRQEKLQKRITFLEREFGIVLTEAESDWLRAQKSPGKPHFGRILVNRGIAPDIDTAIQKYINLCRDGRDRIDADVAIRAILHAGGIPVWAHPLGGEGEKRLEKEQFHAQLQELLRYGIQGLECHYSRYSRQDTAYLTEQAAAHDLLVSGGSDYHGANKSDLPLGRLNTEDVQIRIEDLTLLRHITL